MREGRELGRTRDGPLVSRELVEQGDREAWESRPWRGARTMATMATVREEREG